MARTLNPSVGGRPGMTKHLKQLYDAYNIEQQTTGLQPLDWPVWLDQNGYALGPDKLVVPKSDQDVDRLIQKNLQ